MSQSSAAKWYVIHTYSGYENKVAQSIKTVVENRNLQHLIPEVKVPTETVIEITDNKKKEVEHKVFPGYVLVKMELTGDSWYVVRNIRGVTGFVGPDSEPVPLTDDEVKALGVETVKVSINYAVGDHVKISDGPFKGEQGVVSEIDIDNNMVKVSIHLFGRDTLVELELDQVALLN